MAYLKQHLDLYHKAWQAITGDTSPLQSGYISFKLDTATAFILRAYPTKNPTVDDILTYVDCNNNITHRFKLHKHIKADIERAIKDIQVMAKYLEFMKELNQ